MATSLQNDDDNNNNNNMENSDDEGLIPLLDEVHAAIKLLPEEEKVDYFEAMKKVPDLVTLESDPVRFLYVENHNPQAAAIRLAKYWKYRKQIFGKNRAYLPMMNISLSGGGGHDHDDGTVTGTSTAMDDDDITFMSTGVIIVLPVDTMNRPVLSSGAEGIINKAATILPPISSTQQSPNRLRTLFFRLTKLSMDYPKICQTEGVVIVRYMKNQIIINSASKLEHEIIENVIPLKIHSYHFCIHPKPEQKTHILQRSMPLLIDLIGKTNQNKVHLHVVDTTKEFLKKLVVSGLREDGLPAVLGGTFSPPSPSSPEKLVLLAEDDGNDNNIKVENKRRAAVDSAQDIEGTLESQRAEKEEKKEEKKEDARSSATLDVTLESQRAGKVENTRSPATLDDVDVSNNNNTEGGQGGGAAMSYLFSVMDQMQSERKTMYLDALRMVTATESESHVLEYGRLQRTFEILSAIPYEEKAEYMEATERNPSVVKSESNPIKFLRCCCGNSDTTKGSEKDDVCHAAARRIAMYWKERVNVFGGERGYRSMNLLWGGIFTDNDITMYKKRVIVQLPNDEDGRAVIWADLTRLDFDGGRGCTEEEHPNSTSWLMASPQLHSSLRRCLFYMLTRLSMDTNTEHDGGVVFIYRVESSWFDTCRFFQKTQLLSLFETMPLQLQTLHFCSVSPEQVSLLRDNNTTLSLLKATLEKSCSIEEGEEERIKVHICNTETDLLMELEEDWSFSEENIPRSFGGCWSYDDNNNDNDSKFEDCGTIGEDDKGNNTDPSFVGAREVDAAETYENESGPVGVRKVLDSDGDTTDDDDDEEEGKLEELEREMMQRNAAIQQRIEMLKRLNRKAFGVLVNSAEQPENDDGKEFLQEASNALYQRHLTDSGMSAPVSSPPSPFVPSCGQVNGSKLIVKEGPGKSFCGVKRAADDQVSRGDGSGRTKAGSDEKQLPLCLNKPYPEEEHAALTGTHLTDDRHLGQTGTVALQIGESKAPDSQEREDNQFLTLLGLLTSVQEETTKHLGL